MPELILASASPRRRSLLKQIGVSCVVAPSDICEDALPNEAPEPYTCRLALEKARHCLGDRASEQVVLAADTTVSIDGAILGKPIDEADAIQMLMRLSGKIHQVITGVAVISSQGEDVISVVSDVEFADLTESMCRAYWRSGEPQDKAGSYAVQGLGAVFVKHLKGSYSSVVGLPLHETSQLLAKHGIKVWQLDDL
ncbi:MAG: septum formation inhibitor Maf [Oceanospirillales bacterium]|nr:MAG: septum formation inhibitor Maf [Oceanospirillales bacterium]